MAVLRRHEWKTQGWLRLENISKLTHANWGIADLVSLLPDELRALIPTVVPEPPSGIVPAVASFASIAPDVMYIREVIYRIGAAPGHPVHACEYRDVDEDTGRVSLRYGVLLERSSGDEDIRVLELYTPDEIAEKIDCDEVSS